MGVLFEWHFWTFLGTSLFRKKCYSTKRGRKCDSPPPFFGVEITPSFDGCTFGTFWNFCFPGKVSSSVSLYLSMTTGAQFRTRPFISLLFPRRSHFGQLSPPSSLYYKGKREKKVENSFFPTVVDEGRRGSSFLLCCCSRRFFRKLFFFPFPLPLPPKGRQTQTEDKKRPNSHSKLTKNFIKGIFKP